MKNLLFALSLTLSAVEGFAQTNVYHPFPDSAFWRVDISFYAALPGGGCYANYYFHYYTSGDTLINSYAYKKIYKSFVYRTSWGLKSPCDPVPPFGVSGYQGALRDDSIANKTFFVFPNKSNDPLLYDYSLKAGDTTQGFYKHVVMSVDSVLINGQYRKRWNFNQGYIIEGIGTNSGLFEIITGNPWSYLICVKDSVNTLFTSNHSSPMGCNLILNDVNEIKFDTFLNIFPNPSTGIFALSFSEKTSSIEILDVLGNVINKSQTPTTLNMTIDMSAQSKGVYFVNAMDEKGNFRVKKVVLQ